MPTSPARQVKRAERQLAKKPLPSSLPRPRINCVACNWRRVSNDSIAELAKDGKIPEDYVGFLYGQYEGQLIVTQYHLGRQVAAVVVPMETVPEWLSSIVRYFEAATAPEEGEVDEDEYDDTEEGDYYEEDGDVEEEGEEDSEDDE